MNPDDELAEQCLEKINFFKGRYADYQRDKDIGKLRLSFEIARDFLQIDLDCHKRNSENKE